MKKRLEQNLDSQRGNILFTAVLLLVVMNLLAIGLVQVAMKENKAASTKQVDTVTFQATESCIRDMVAWLKTFNRPTDLVPYTITKANLNEFVSNAEPQSVRDKFTGYNYNCTIRELMSKSIEGQEAGYGERVHVGDGYGSGGNLSPRYFYEITAVGQGPNQSSKTIVSLVSVQF
jgi:Tfp pilus assembly protein PilX